MNTFKIDPTSKTFTDLDPTISLAEQFLGGSDTRIPYEKIHYYLSNMLRNTEHLALFAPIDHRIYRGRACNDSEIKSISELKYKPSTMISDFGRCHTPGNSVFYGSNSEMTVFSELNPEEGDEIYLCCAKLKNGEDAQGFVAVGEIDHYRRFNNFSIDFIGEAKKTVQELINGYKNRDELATSENNQNI